MADRTFSNVAFDLDGNDTTLLSFEFPVLIGSATEEVAAGTPITIYGIPFTYSGVATATNVDGGPIYVFSAPNPLTGDSIQILASDGEIPTGSFGPVNPAPIFVCFAAGTMIATPAGARAVETLQAGDEILAADGRTVAVKWMGYQTVSRTFTPAERFCPVRIRAGALGENLPATDLVVTADHGILIDGVMANAGALVNGTSIVRVPAEELEERVTYYHVETENHDVILANGVETETYVDGAVRRFFDNYAEWKALFGDEDRDMVELSYPRATSRRQLPARIKAALDRRAAEAGTVEAVAA